jgi:hypothetical protein
MSRTYLTFGDIAGKLTMLRVECTRCERKGRYNVAKLLAQHGHRGNMSKMGLRPERRLSLSNSLEAKRLELLRKLIPTASGGYVSGILKGKKPAVSPIMQPTKFEFVIKRKDGGHVRADVPRRSSSRLPTRYANRRITPRAQTQSVWSW